MGAQQILDTVHKTDPIGFWSKNGFEAKKVADFLDFKNRDLAKIANVKLATVRYDKRIPETVLLHLTQIANICSLVAELLDKDIEKTKLWLETPNPAIGDISPKQMMRYGRYDKLLKFVLLAKQNRAS